jgi:hypothetical protein
MSNRPAALEVSMMRSSLSLTLVTAAAVAGLVSPPRLAAQSAPTSARPAVAESELGPNDAANMRLLVGDEARHRDRVARLARLRTLAEQRGQTDRLAELDRLTQMESEHFEARSLLARSRLSDGALLQADDFVRRGGVLKMRRANLAAGQDADRTRRPGHDTEAVRAKQARRSQAAPSKSVKMGSSMRGRASGSGGRSPR